MELNSRELATLAWIGIVGTAMLVRADTRNASLSLWSAFAQPKILGVMGILAVYIAAMIVLLKMVCVWDWDQLKNTIIWTLSVALVAVFQSNKIADEPGYFRRWVIGNFEVQAFLQFLITLYTYPLWLEFAVIPIVAFVGGMIAVGRYKPEAKRATDMLKGFAGLFGLIFFGFALIMTIVDFKEYATIQTWRDLYMPIVMSLALLPFIFILYLFISYETQFSLLQWAIEDAQLRRRAKWLAVYSFGFDIVGLKRWVRQLQMNRPTRNEDVKTAVRDVKADQRTERDTRL